VAYFGNYLARRGRKKWWRYKPCWVDWFTWLGTAAFVIKRHIHVALAVASMPQTPQPGEPVYPTLIAILVSLLEKEQEPDHEKTIHLIMLEQTPYPGYSCVGIAF